MCSKYEFLMCCVTLYLAQIDVQWNLYNERLYDEIYFLWFIHKCVLIKTEGTKLLLLTIPAFWSSSRWPLAT